MCFFGLKIIHRFQLSTHFVFSFSTFSFSPGLGCQIHRWCFHAWWPAAVRSVSHTLEGRGGSCQVRVGWNSLLCRFCNHGKYCLMCVLVKFFTCFYQKGRRCLFFTPIFSRHFYTLRFPAFAFKVTVGWSFPRLPLSIFFFATFESSKFCNPPNLKEHNCGKGDIDMELAGYLGGTFKVSQVSSGFLVLYSEALGVYFKPWKQKIILPES